jgi:hypothetical protein
MLFIPHVQSTVRRSLIGANATDPVLPERRRSGRRPRRATLEPRRGRFTRTPKTASQPS